jgi:queuine tRNA-ribosyltransferase
MHAFDQDIIASRPLHWNFHLHFELQATCPSTGARAGLLHTAHGIVETPVFMPVGTQATLKGVLPRDIESELDAKIILSNTYHLFLRPGHQTIRALGGLHKFMAWPRAILTDSGGFQVFSLNSLTKIDENGVVFKSHLNGDPHLFTPESTIDVQLALGSDIMMVLDECLPYPSEPAAARRAMERTARWARRCVDRWKANDPERRQGCFPIVQGAMDPALRRESAARTVELDAPGYAIGGLSVGEPRDLSLEMVDLTAPLLPKDKPRYVMGVGLPEELPQYVARGVDMMDCVLPSRSARHGMLFTSAGRVLIKQSRFKDDPDPVDRNCSCYTCRTFSRAYLRHLFLANEILYATLATMHNLRFYLDIMRAMRQSILLGAFPQYLAGLNRLEGQLSTT